MLKKTIVLLLIAALVLSPSVNYAQPATVLGLPQAGAMVDLSPAYVPVLIKGLKIHQDNPLAMDFIVDTGNTGLNLAAAHDKEAISDESSKLIKYFLAALTLPEKDVWVNLSPYEKDRIIPVGLGQTEMGRDMLAQDYILKQITASLIYPEKGLGKDFWNKVYKEAYDKFGTNQVPINTFNKVWIVADKATVYENKDTAFVVNAHLKVMLEEDYLAMHKNGRLPGDMFPAQRGTCPHAGCLAINPLNAKAPQGNYLSINEVGSQIVRQIILPALETEVNNGRNFANLRQIFHSLILAKWYKQALKTALINQVYSNRTKLSGVDVDDKAITQKIYTQYLQAYKKGVFNFIKEDIDRATQQPIPRKYFSGGVLGNMDLAMTHNPKDAALAAVPVGQYLLVADTMGKVDRAMSSFSSWTNQGYIVNVQTAKEVTVAGMNISPYELLRAREVGNIAINGKSFLDMVNEARDWLKSKRSLKYAGNYYIKELTDKGSQRLKYGFAVDHGTKTLYLSPAFLKQLAKQSSVDNFNFIVRKIIFMSSSDVDQGRKLEYQYALETFPAEVVHLFPKDSDPTSLFQGITDGLLLADDQVNYHKLAERIIAKAGLYAEMEHAKIVPVEDAQEIVPGSVGIRRPVIIEAGKSALRSNQEIMERAKSDIYLLGINALDKIADYREHVPKNSWAQFSSKFNPVTIAQTFITVLSTFALSSVSGYYVNVSQSDPRKPDVHKSFKARWSLARAEIEGLFKKLITLLSGEDNPDYGKWNGEEVAIMQAASHHYSRYVYTAGGDHYYVWAPFNADHDKNIFPTLNGFDSVDGKTIEYYSFYAGVGKGQDYGFTWKEYQRLVALQNEKGNRLFFDRTLSQTMTDTQRKDPTLNQAEREKVIKAILSAKSQEDMDEVFKQASILPRLDTAGKMILARKAQPNIDFILAHTIRKDSNFGDTLRDFFVKEGDLRVFNVDGLASDISATRTRQGLVGYLFGIINFNLLYGASVETLQKVFSNSDRKPLETLLRQSPLMLPLSIKNMLGDNSERHRGLIVELNKKVQVILGKDFEIKESVEPVKVDSNGVVISPGRSIITVLKINKALVESASEDHRGSLEEQTPVVTIQYAIESTMDPNGDFLNLLHSNITFGEETAPKPTTHKLSDIVVSYIKDYNNAIDIAKPKDAAMSAPLNETATVGQALISTAVNPGGIDFNANQMQLNVLKQGAGVVINLDPAMIASFENSDFQGFVPVIINISTIGNIAPYLGLEKDSSLVNSKI